MERTTERLNFDDGSWWEIYTVVTRGMRKIFNQAAMASVASGLKAANGAVDLTDADSMKRAVLGQADQIDLNTVDDAYLLYGTKAYSYGAVELSIIDTLPDIVVAKVLDRMRELYAAPTKAESKKGIVTS